MSLFYSRKSKLQLLGLLDQDTFKTSIKSSHKCSMCFTYNGITISWRFVKQTMVATFSNHLETLKHLYSKITWTILYQR